jgi:hypothetical protein
VQTKTQAAHDQQPPLNAQPAIVAHFIGHTTVDRGQLALQVQPLAHTAKCRLVHTLVQNLPEQQLPNVVVKTANVDVVAEAIVADL